MIEHALPQRTSCRLEPFRLQASIKLNYAEARAVVKDWELDPHPTRLASWRPPRARVFAACRSIRVTCKKTFHCFSASLFLRSGLSTHPRHSR